MPSIPIMEGVSRVIGCLESVVSFFMQDCHLELRKKRYGKQTEFESNILGQTHWPQIFVRKWTNLTNMFMSYLTPKCTIKNKTFYF